MWLQVLVSQAHWQAVRCRPFSKLLQLHCQHFGSSLHRAKERIEDTLKRASVRTSSVDGGTHSQQLLAENDEDLILESLPPASSQFPELIAAFRQGLSICTKYGFVEEATELVDICYEEGIGPLSPLDLEKYLDCHARALSFRIGVEKLQHLFHRRPFSSDIPQFVKSHLFPRPNHAFEGIVLIDKPSSVTSGHCVTAVKATVLNELRRHYSSRHRAAELKVGHCGTVSLS